MTKNELKLLNTLDRQFRKLEAIPLEAVPKLRAIIHRAPDEALLAMISRKIKFCDTVANSELVSRGVFSESARMDHAVDVLMANHG